MKKLLLISLSVALLFLLTPNQSVAQGKGKGNKSGKAVQKKPGPPPWAPAHGYRAKTRYVYFSDYEVYYDHDRGVYISLSGSNWSVSARLPSILSRVDLTAAVKVDLDFDGDEPHKNHAQFKKKYPKKKKKK